MFLNVGQDLVFSGWLAFDAFYYSASVLSEKWIGIVSGSFTDSARGAAPHSKRGDNGSVRQSWLNVKRTFDELIV